MNDVKIIFRWTAQNRDRLKAKLKKEGITQTDFYRECGRAYLDDEKMLKKLIEKLLQRLGRTKFEIKKTVPKKKENEFLDDKEVVDLFDMFEKENPDL